MNKKSIVLMRTVNAKQRRHGVALVLVLSFLVIISGLIIAFFSMVTSEASTAGTNAAATSAKTLADSAVSYVMGTIVDATLGHDPQATDVGGPANAWSWASQPGMIRVYDNTGKPQYIYKLYSADAMKLTQVPSNFGDTPLNSGWATGVNRDVWVDMNEPIRDSTNTDIYPILDPSASEDYKTLVSQYPGRSDLAPYNQHRVEGFNLLQQGQNAGTSPVTSDPNTPPRDPNNNNPAPMPVKWLYVLQDGTLTTAAASGTTVQLNSTLVSATNPIKGRIAFWTDDECSKVNINTASQGTYWDIPRVMSSEDSGTLVSTSLSSPEQAKPGQGGMGLCQPVKGEYQRYPGHPATTSLSPIFGFIGSNNDLQPVLPVPTPAPSGASYSTTDVQKIAKYYALTPRLGAAGSLSGTTVSTTAMLPPTSVGGLSTSNYWRLYASVDELLFNATAPSSGGSGDGVHRIANLPGNTSPLSVITPDVMQKAKFFLTANSSAPEITLFNTPRVSMWPINDVTQVAPWSGKKFKLTPYDQLAQFCASVGYASNSGGTTTRINPFYFTRWNARDTTADCTPGSRNMQLYNYLQKLTSLHVPGDTSGGTFLDKFSAGPGGFTDRDQLLTCIFDYIRCVNIQDSTIDPDNAGAIYPPYAYTPTSRLTGGGQSAPFPGGGEVIPIKIPNTGTQGFGRYNTVAGVYLLVFAAHGRYYLGRDMNTGNAQDASKGEWIPQPQAPFYNGEEGVADALGVVFMMSFNSVMQGNVGNHPKMKYQVDGLNNLTFTAGPFLPVDPSQGVPIGPHTFAGSTAGGSYGPASVLPPTGTNFIETADVRTWHGRGIGGTASPVMAFCNGTINVVANTKACLKAGTAALGNYPFFGYTDTLPFPAADQTKAAMPTNVYFPTRFLLHHQGTPGDPKTDIIITAMAAHEIPTPGPNDQSDVVVQKFHIRFPDGVFRMPTPVASNSANVPPGGYGDDPDVFTIRHTGVGAGGSNVPGYAVANKPFFFNPRMIGGQDGSATDSFIRPTDTVIGMEAGGTLVDTGTAQKVDHTAGDFRMYAALPEVPTQYPNPPPVQIKFQPDWRYVTTPDNALFASIDPSKQPDYSIIPQHAHNLMRSVGSIDLNNPPNNTPLVVDRQTYGTGVYNGVVGPAGSQVPEIGHVNLGQLINLGNTFKVTNLYSRWPDVPRHAGEYVTRRDGGPGSWDTGMGLHKDGAYINKPDEGDEAPVRSDNNTWRVPYIDKEDYFGNVGSFFSPNREIPSSMMLGSMPVGIQRQLPWQTLLFHPALADTTNPELIGVPDHYLADLFWIPIVEPYAISQPFSTAGKINMNYQIEPFTYIRRTTAMRAVMASTKMMAIRANDAANYKPDFGNSNGFTVSGTRRYPINLDCTMTMLDQRFANNDIYRSATEISTIPLIPNDLSQSWTKNDSYASLYSQISTYWGDGRALSPTTHQLTGNNVRDKPYADLYGRLTTKSNAFTVHIRAQALRKATNTPVNQWVSGRDQVVAEYRGSSLIERYIDANDPFLPDFATQTTINASSPQLNIDQYYKFRVVSSKRFAP